MKMAGKFRTGKECLEEVQVPAEVAGRGGGRQDRMHSPNTVQWTLNCPNKRSILRRVGACIHWQADSGRAPILA